MASENERIQEVIRKLEKSILEDGKVDRAEALILLSFAKPKAAGNAEMTEFVAAAQLLLADMLCGRLPDRKLPRAELLRLVALMRTAETYLRFNVSTKHLLGLLAVDGVWRDAEE